MVALTRGRAIEEREFITTINYSQAKQQCGAKPQGSTDEAIVVIKSVAGDRCGDTLGGETTDKRQEVKGEGPKQYTNETELKRENY